MKKTLVDWKKYLFLLVFFLSASLGCKITARPVFAAEDYIQAAADSLFQGLDSLLNKWTDSKEATNVYTIYISGIDTRGAMEEKSRSDVNIIATINTATKEILLVSTPRDYYVPLSISNGVPDKLTHAGNYGVDVCMDTLEMLYDIDIDYYLRFNFQGFVKIIDTLGGITVYSDYDFSAGGYQFYKGENHLNGEEALAFVRERYSFSEGDRQRGKNQMHVMESVLEQLGSFDLVANIDDLLGSVKGSYETNIPYTTLIQLGISEFSHLDKYQVNTYSVDGTGATEKPYSMSEKAYVMIPDQSTVETAKEKMAQVRGEK